ncbi:MAG: hypothetical protein M1383_04305 [Patescibacteria group bacterium]|nr:hypothetical protein [Patescibacteria group bacterium]
MDIDAVLSQAIQAPSGDNCQPWEIQKTSDGVEIFNVPAKDQSLYNFRQQASYLAHGALLENFSIAAKHLGFDPDVKLFPDANNLNLVARIKLRIINPQPQQLFECIAKRTTNRKPYKNIDLPPVLLETLESAASDVPGVRLMLAKGAQQRNILAKSSAINEQAVLENEYLHKFLFQHVVWTRKQLEQLKSGMFIKTLEMPRPAETVFKMASSWKTVCILNKLGLSKIVAKQNEQVYNHSAAFGLIVIKNNNHDSFVRAGQALERVWLNLTKEDLSLHPVAGIIFLILRIKGGGVKEISDKHQKMVLRSYENIKNVFHLDDTDIPAFMFRLGQGGKPSATSPRLPLKSLLRPGQNF